MAANPLVDLVIKIRGDTSSATASMQELGQVTTQTGNGLSGISAPAQAAATSLTMLDREGRKFIDGLRDQAATIGMSRLEIAEYRAAQLGMAAEAAPLIARLKEVGASVSRTGAEAVGLGESEAEASARLKEMVARSMEAQRALTQTASASRDAAGGADALGASGAQVSATIAAQNKEMIDAQRASMLMNDEMQALRTTLAQGNASFATLGEQYSRLDRAMATGKLSMQEYDAALAAIGKDEDKRLQSLNTLTSKYDPLGAATRKLADDQALLDDAYKSGQLTTAQYQQALAGIKADQAVVQLRRLADQEAELRRAFKAGTVSSRDYKAALAEIGSNRSALSEIAGGADKGAKAMHGFSLSTNAARREMVVLAHEAATGSWTNFGSSLMVMAEQSNALGVIMSPLGATIGVAGAAVAGMAVAVALGAHESDELTKSLKLTGGAAGVTAGGVTQLARAIADDTGKSMGVAREALQALVSTGEFTGAALALAGEDVVKFAELSGESLEKVVADYAKMPEGVTKWAAEHNRQLNYMSEADYERIKTLEDAGKTEDALMANLTLLHKHFADEAEEKLGWVQSAWRSVSLAIKDGWDALKDVGREETPEKRMAKIAARQRDESSGNVPVVFQDDAYAVNKGRGTDTEDFYAAQMEADSSAVAAFAKAQEDVNQKAGIRAAESLEKALHSYDKAFQKGEELKKRKAEFVDLFKANPNSDKLNGVKVTGDDAAGYTVSGGLYDNLVADINKRYDEKSRTTHAESTGNREVASLKADIAARQQQLSLIDQYGMSQAKVSEGDKKVFQIESQLALAQQDRTGKVSDAQLKEQLGYAKQLAAIEKQIEARTREGEALKAYTAQVDKWTGAVESEQAALEQDLVLYGTTGEARKLIASQLKFESEARTTIAKALRDGHPLSEQQQKDLLAEASARGKTVASIQAQREALAGAQKLREENERFAADSIFDE
ncbi:phage tail length tape measure family protein [Caballeronia sp. LjRoot31]|uniref:phage tail length tape measure family protein n=1 Tax=Caballeronia sp. LjRoot31 TaxID=3342324 RepID=UPI003ED0812B